MSISLDLEPRTYYSRFENALADLAPPLEAVPAILEVVRGLRYAHVFIPESRAYIALESDDGGAPIAYVMAHVIALHPRDGVSSFVPVLEETTAGDDAAAEEAEDPGAPCAAAPSTPPAPAAPAAAPVVTAPVVCTGCFTNLPATGRCDYCD